MREIVLPSSTEGLNNFSKVSELISDQARIRTQADFQVQACDLYYVLPWCGEGTALDDQSLLHWKSPGKDPDLPLCGPRKVL